MRRRYIALILLAIVTAPHTLNLSWSGHHDHLTLRYAPS
jgi:hypothetical protein